MTGRYVNRADDPVRTLSDQVGERIAAGLAGQQAAEVVPMKRGALWVNASQLNEGAQQEPHNRRCFAPILLQNSFCIVDYKIPGP